MTADVLPGFLALTAEEVADRPWSSFGGAPNVWWKELFASGDQVAGLMRFDAGTHEVRHLHVGGSHHAYVLEGAVRFDGSALAAGSYVHVPEGMTHTMTEAGGEGCTLFFVYARQP